MFCHVVDYIKKELSAFIRFVRFKDPFNAMKVAINERA